MTVIGFQHVNIRCVDAGRSRDFYVTLLGLREGSRPPFASRGFWLYLGDQPVVHLVQRPEGEAALPGRTGNLDHVAFSAADVMATREALKKAAVPYRETTVPRDGTIQIFLADLDGVPLELNFSQP